jgi:hypothetical protein
METSDVYSLELWPKGNFVLKNNGQKGSNPLHAKHKISYLQSTVLMVRILFLFEQITYHHLSELILITFYCCTYIVQYKLMLCHGNSIIGRGTTPPQTKTTRFSFS